VGPLRAVLLRFCLLAVLLVLALSACAMGVTRVPIPHGPPLPTSSPATPKAVPGQPDPVRLVIAAIGVNAVVESVGVKANGDLETPTHNPWEDVGWYSTGPRPGEQGSAVIDGHVDRTGGGPAVFWRLSDLHVGDRVVVTDSAGKTRTFHVTRIAFYQPQDAPLQDIFGNWGGVYLNLITCAGDWIPSQHQTTLRLVVYTKVG
jgi:LPXTG-site transpeptidase (sortase) family protein